MRRGRQSGYGGSAGRAPRSNGAAAEIRRWELCNTGRMCDAGTKRAGGEFIGTRSVYGSSPARESAGHTRYLLSRHALLAAPADSESPSSWRDVGARVATLHVRPPFYDLLRRKSRSTTRARLIGIRVLGFLLQDMWQHQRHSFGLIPYKALIKQITPCLSIDGVVVGSKEEAQARHAKLQNLGLYFRNHLMRVFRSNGGPVPKSSSHPSRPSLDVARDRIINDIRNATTLSGARSRVCTYRALRSGTLITLTRHSSAMVIAYTGQYDLQSSVTYPELDQRATAEGRTLAGTQCAHIFSETAKEGEAKLEYAASAMAILEAFGLTSKIENLIGGNVHWHQYFNILTMQTDLHLLFDGLNLWLEEVIGEENTYTVCSVKDRVLKMVRPRVTFRVDPDLEAACVAKGIPVPALPSPSLLAIRAACTRVAHMQHICLGPLNKSIAFFVIWRKHRAYLEFRSCPEMVAVDVGKFDDTSGMGKVPLCRFKLPLHCFALPLTAATRASLGVQLPRKPAAARCIAADCRNNPVTSAACSGSALALGCCYGTITTSYLLNQGNGLFFQTQPSRRRCLGLTTRFWQSLPWLPGLFPFNNLRALARRFRINHLRPGPLHCHNNWFSGLDSGLVITAKDPQVSYYTSANELEDLDFLAQQELLDDPQADLAED
ncbi:hypothetical protein GGX14DRAFT_678980 [Mycena pura]|uniref:HNH nuclease domain-containing protein n=1 Tax=Mycena pura TaxID=153505 RepID=A0AAD6UTD5_9AGAR|nr:hypothetical protein GGX14DRAFT_678980 [Mycena pura]